jgi:hypothetical protein
MESFNQRPKRSATFVWDALKTKAKQMNKPLYVQSVQIPKLVKLLQNERGYKIIGGEELDGNEICCIDLVLITK